MGSNTTADAKYRIRTIEISLNDTLYFIGALCDERHVVQSQTGRL